MAKQRKLDECQSVADELRDDDGIDPREYKKIHQVLTSSGKPDYSAFRLAKQIRIVLDVMIPQSGNPLLVSFVVGSVKPSPKGGPFIVQVYSSDESMDYDPRQIKCMLDEMKPGMRAELAKEINRKKTPDFKFDILPPRVQPR